MNILAVDDEKIALKLLTDTIRKVCPSADVYSFSRVSEALAFAKECPCEVAFLDIHMRESNGIETARKLKHISPYINIIFETAYSEYMGDAFSLHASGYILKPVTALQIQEELTHLRNPQALQMSGEKLSIHTFGNFDVFYNGDLVHFPRAKSKELLAYLIDRKGASSTMAEIAAILWEDEEYNRSLLNQIHSFLSDLIKQLKKIHQEDIIVKKRNSLAINTEKVDCDYYRFLKGDVFAINAFTNEYMTNYSWAEFTVATLRQQK